MRVRYKRWNERNSKRNSVPRFFFTPELLLTSTDAHAPSPPAAAAAAAAAAASASVGFLFRPRRSRTGCAATDFPPRRLRSSNAGRSAGWGPENCTSTTTLLEPLPPSPLPRSLSPLASMLTWSSPVLVPTAPAGGAPSDAVVVAAGSAGAGMMVNLFAAVYLSVKDARALCC